MKKWAKNTNLVTIKIITHDNMGRGRGQAKRENDVRLGGGRGM